MEGEGGRQTPEMSEPAPWGEWMTGYKTGLRGEADDEAGRLSRAAAAFGAETMAKLKDLNILIVGLRGVGVETAKNLILSNVGAVVVRDPAAAAMRDMGSNFYLSEAHVQAGATRADACLPQLKTLNPHCKVEAYDGELSDEYLLSQDVNGTGKPFAAVIVTQLLPKAELFRVNQTARANGITFLMALTSGVTASIFSDFGPAHVITDPNGEPMEAQALSNIEVISKPPSLCVPGVEDGEAIVVLTCDSNHGLQSGDVVELEDMNGAMEPLNGRKYKVRTMEFQIFDPKREFVYATAADLLKNSTGYLAQMWQKQHDTHKAESEANAAEFWKQYELKADTSFKGKLRQITFLNRLVLTEVEDAGAFGSYTNGGLITPVVQPVEKAYRSLEESLVSTTAQVGAPDVAARFPQMLEAEAGGRGDGIDVHLAYAAVLDFQEKMGAWPRTGSAADAAEVLSIAEGISESRKDTEGAIWAQALVEPNWTDTFDNTWGVVRKLDGARIRRFSRFFGAELTGFCAYLGGAIAQEAIKKTGKFTPVDQWIHHEDQALVTDECASNTGPPMNGRYDDQITILGKDFQQRAAAQRVFLVGCGALGCEYLKGLAMMGVGVGDQGKVTVTDMDTIELSNLSRQFLFRGTDVGNSKSISGARVVREWNPDMNVEGVEQFVGASTEHIFKDEFWENIDLCWNALDNVQARQYTDGRCLWYSKPLLESGTTGTKSNSEVILPFRTSTYNDGEDPEPVGIAKCTLRNFPYLPIHCIEFAKEKLFEEQFEFGVEQYNAFREDKATFFESLADMGDDEERMNAMKVVKLMIDVQKGGAVDFATCVRLAFAQMIRVYRDTIIGVISAGDETEKSSGKPYWTGTKRKPNPLEWSAHDAMGMEYLYAAANLYAAVFGQPHVRDRAEFEAQVRALSLAQPDYEAAEQSGDAMEGADGDDEEVKVDAGAKAALESELQGTDVASLIACVAHDFEKDDDDNFHIDYLTIATNLRSWNYNIKESERSSVKVIAGRIIPALATTTAMVCGLVDIEFCKLVLGLQNLGNSKFLQSNINLATGSEAFSVFNPSVPEALTNLRKTNLTSFESFTTWDKLEYAGDLSGAELARRLQADFGVKVLALAGETNYNPAKSVPLWQEGGGGGASLSSVFLEKFASGEEEKDRSAQSKKAAKAVLKMFGKEPLEGVAVAQNPADEYAFQVTMQGPAGTAYEGGTFLINVKLPLEYPAKAPVLSFVTQIEHCNIADGVPCPGLLSLSADRWSPAMTVHSVLRQLEQLLKDQSKGDALRPELTSMDDAAFFAIARASARAHATAGQAFPAAPPKKKAEKKQVWAHSYLILKGDFENADGEQAFLPRIKLKFTMAKPGGGGGGGAAAAEPVEPCDAEVEAKVLAMELEFGGEACTVKSCYKLQPARVALLSPLAEGLTAANAVAVSCEFRGELIETIVRCDTMEHCKYEDLIMCAEDSLAGLAEAQFEEGGNWVLSRGGRDGIEQEKASLFGNYEGSITKDPPDCLSTLRRMLQAGPITKLYTGGGSKFVPSHEGFALRMPAADVAAWQMVNDKGELADIPRPSHALRLWDAASRSYASMDATLDGAPTDAASTDAWFVGVVRKLKASNYVGPAILDALVGSKKTESMEALGNGDFEAAFSGEFSNRWSELVLSTKL